jgi:hypothetical protein
MTEEEEDVKETRTTKQIIRNRKKISDLWHIGPTVARSAMIIYSDFHHCQKGNAREIWDIIVSNQPRTTAQFKVQL